MPNQPLGPWNDATRTQLGNFQLPVLTDARSQIRLIRMKPGSGSEHIACELTSISLKEAPPYAAISYTWGDPRPVIDIRLNDRPLKVHHNCWYALWQARLHGLYDYYWLDAICIDQANLAEKSAQVQLMGDIFSQGARVVVSLGRHGDDSAYVLHVARELDASAWCMKLEMPSSERDNLRAEWYGIMSLDDPGNSQRLADAWHGFCSRPYWHRAWIVQELILAQPLAVTMMCDTESVDWYTILQLYDDITINLMPSYTYDATPFTNILQFRDRVDMGFPPLADALTFSNKAECSDVRDRIYSFLRLSYWPENLPPLIPDYTRTTFKLALEAVKYLEQHRNAFSDVETLLKALRIDAKTPEMIALVDERCRDAVDRKEETDAAPLDLPEKECHASVHWFDCCHIRADDSGQLTAALRDTRREDDLTKRATPLVDQEGTMDILTHDSRIAARVTSRARDGDILVGISKLSRYDSPLVRDRACLVFRRCVTQEGDLYEIVGQAVLEYGFQICANLEHRACKCVLDPSGKHPRVDTGFRLYFGEEDLIALLGQDGTDDEDMELQLLLRRPTVRATASRWSSYALARSQEELETLASADWQKVTRAGMANAEKMEKVSRDFLSAANQR